MPDVATSSIRFRGLIAPEETPTGDNRVFAANSLSHRPLPRPVMFTRTLTQRHQGAVAVARLEEIEYFPGRGWVGSGAFLDPRIVPEVTEAVYLAQQGVSSPSVDLQPDLTYEIVPHRMRPSEEVIRVLVGRIMGFTFVPYPAFEETRIMVGSDEDLAILASAGVTFAVNSSSWRSMPIADREEDFEFEAAVRRVLEWSNGSPSKFRQAFLYQSGDRNNRQTYRLPIADIHGGTLTLIPRAVFSAAAFLSGAHGGLPDIPDSEQESIRGVITEIYDVLRERFGDPRTRPPWQRGGRQGARGANQSGGTMPTYTLNVETGTVTQVSDTNLVEFAVDDNGECGNTDTSAAAPAAFQDEGADECPEGQVRGEDGECVDAESDDDDSGDGAYALSAAGNVHPPKEWFDSPGLTRPTPLTVEDDGRVYGHLASFNECHVGIGNKCVTAPKSATNYAHFLTGEAVTADGSRIPVGKITLGTGHADASLGYIPAAEHYDHTGAVVAVVNIGEDRHGIWVAGSLVAGADEQKVAELRRSPLSGDWRRVGGNLELVAALAVNTPGFPVLRASAEDELETLMAAGVVSEFGAEDENEARARRWRELDESVRVERARDLLGTERGSVAGASSAFELGLWLDITD